MSPATSDVAEVVKAALEAEKTDALNADPPESAVYIGEPREEDYPLPRHYQVLHVTTGAGGGYRLAGGRSAEKYRLVVRSVGSTYAEATWETDRAKAALDDKVLTLAGFDWQQNDDESDRTVAPDNDLPDLYDGVRVWTTVIGPLSA